MGAKGRACAHGESALAEKATDSSPLFVLFVLSLGKGAQSELVESTDHLLLVCLIVCVWREWGGAAI